MDFSLSIACIYLGCSISDFIIDFTFVYVPVVIIASTSMNFIMQMCVGLDAVHNNQVRLKVLSVSIVWVWPWPCLLSRMWCKLWLRMGFECI